MESSGVISTLLLCGIGYAISINEETAAVEPQINKLVITKSNSGNCSERQQNIETYEPICVLKLHAKNCQIMLCPNHGNLNCFNEEKVLTTNDIAVFGLSACEGSLNNKSCKMRKDSIVLIFQKEECDFMCRLLK